MRDLEPVGYWPADEGRGEMAHDRSGSQNHGTIYSVPWRDGLLDFENDVYQWIEIAHHSDYASPAFSMGGWVFSRREYSKKHYGVLIIGQPFTPRPPKDGALAWAIWGGRLETDGAMLRFGPPPGDSPGPSLIEVVSGQQKDAVGSVAEQVELATGEWQHVFYTYDESGTGRLYLNGKLAQSADDVPYKVADTPFAIGGGRWIWHGCKSLDGSVRDMALFDRALEAEEVASLYEATQPEKEPSPSEPPRKETSRTVDDLDELIAQVRDEELEEADRAEAALALAEMGEEAADAGPALRAVLEAITERDGTHLPRIEDLLRNAVMRALLDIAPEDEPVRDLLGETLASPFFETLDLSKSYLDKIRPLVQEGRYMDGLEALRAHLETVPKLPELRGWGAADTEEQLDTLREYLPLREEYFDAYLNRGFPFSDAHYKAYSQVDVHNGTTWIPLVERVPWEEVKTEYENSLKDLAEEEPDPEGKWSRLKILKIAPDGSEREVILGGPWLIFDARDAKMDGWSIAIDQQGYIHLTGGQHNHPNRSYWLPGSWKKLGIASEEKDWAEVMYWVSEEPGSIDSFEFVGEEDNPRSFNGWINYMQFARSPDRTLFLFGRGRAWSWAMQRYDAAERRWTEISGSASEMLDRARRENPHWYECLGGKVQYHGPGDGLVAAFQLMGYNINRAWPGRVKGIGGVEFDRTGRMHVQMPIFGVGEAGRMTSGPVYAYSDDLGETFHRADGTPLELPLTVNPIPGHDADMDHHSTRQWFDLWMSLIREAGWSRKGGFDWYQ
ncbi:MAG: LamG-like jellyroll fold domain-containing protein [Pirellulaceae bacterium]